MKERRTKIARALISVSDKRGLLELTKALSQQHTHILSTGGTAALLREKRIKVTEVSEYTAQAEILGGRVKTLHPKIHGGILARRDDLTHLSTLERHEIKPIDLVVVNLYPFEQTIARPEVKFDEAIENIDIGGPSLIRAAAKNWEDVTVVVDPEDYPRLIRELEDRGGVARQTRFQLAQKAFALTARYDGAICNWLHGLGGEGNKLFSDVLNFQAEKIQDLRYGENPHQRAAFYKDVAARFDEPSVVGVRQLQGKELSFNNILDLDGAIELLKEFAEPVCVILKHTTPCGIARAKNGQGMGLQSLFVAARDVDPLSAFGGVIGFNRAMDKQTAETVIDNFYGVVVAPEFSSMVRAVFEKKKDLRILEWPMVKSYLRTGFDIKKVAGGLLVQERNLDGGSLSDAKVVTKRKPTPEEWEALSFAWKLVKHVKSNAVVLTTVDRALGIGAGQMSRVDAVKMAIAKAGARHSLPLAPGVVMASEAFFPFRDSIDQAARVGVTAVVHPGGSRKDDESIQAANEANIAMVFTGIRYFRH